VSPARASLAEVLAAIPDAAAILGAGGEILLSNPALDALHGRLAVGRTILEVTRSTELLTGAQAALGGRAQRLAVELPASGRSAEAFVSPVATGEALLILRDLTAARRLEASRRDFVANASHELRTPVTAIAGAAETLLSGAIPLHEDARTFLEMIDRHARRLSELTQDLLDLTRLESGDWKPSLEPLEAEGALRHAAELLRPKAEERKIRVEIVPAGGARIRADRRALEQILVNLLDNAIKYSPVGGQATLEAGRDGGAVTLSVRDTGSGIEARHLPRLFERFYRVDPGRAREAGGTGLGLAIVKHLTQAQGGEAGVESGPGGSRFWVRLPAA
jgi:two-component system phosphate regulon sensor histidine kinase PhoR